MIEMSMIGNLVRDPESRSIGDKSVCNFTVAVNGRRKTDESIFVRVSAWGGTGENCQKYLTKGKKVFVNGIPSARAYKDANGEAKSSLELIAREVEFLSGKSESSIAEDTPAKEENVPKFSTVEDDGGLPF